MWILDCESEEALSGRKIWLKPGSECVVGRSVNPAVHLVIAAKSISRVHLKIKVGEVPVGNGLRALARSPISLEAQETMYGTFVDGEELAKGETTVLHGTEHTLKLARYEHIFRIKWQPIIFSFSLSTKEKKDKKIMAGRQSKLEKYDIKTLETFIPSTTHVVASKRNTAIGLQALVNGRYIVTEDYLNAVVKVCQPSGGERSLLEEDLEKNWPDPMDYVPPSSNEPNPREDSYFAPKPERQNIFEGWSIIFCEKVQYENFLGPITDGGGKLERFDLAVRETPAWKLVDFIKKKGTGHTAIVRFRGKGDKNDDAWYNSLSSEVSEALNLRMVEQNEFLDIILTGDTSPLRRPLEEEVSIQADNTNNRQNMGPPQLPTKGAVGSGDDDVTMDEIPEPALVSKSQVTRSRRLGIRKPQPKFEMDELFSMPGDPLPAPESSQFYPSSSIAETQYSQVPDLAQAPATQTAIYDDNSAPIPSTQVGISPTQDQTQGVFIKTVVTQSSRKRSIIPADEDEDDPDLMNKLFPGAAAMKKRRIQEEEEESARRAMRTEDDIMTETPLESARNEEETQAKSGPKSQAKSGPKSQARGRKVKTENLILTAAREVKEEEEEKKKREMEDSKGYLDDEAIQKLKNLGVEELIEIKPRGVVMRVNAYGEDSERWDPNWNGRPNFKKFRKRLPPGMDDGGRGITSVRGNVIIPLVEHESRKGSLFEFPGESRSQKQDPSETELDDGFEEISARTFSRRGNGSHLTVPQPGTQMESASSQSLSAGSSYTIECDSISSRRVTTTGSKRPRADNTAPKGPAEKRARKFLITKDESESSDEDKLKFTFRKRGGR